MMITTVMMMVYDGDQNDDDDDNDDALNLVELPCASKMRTKNQAVAH